MGQFFGRETLTEILKLNSTTVRLPYGSNILIGGQGYILETNLDLDVNTVGVGGLESAVQANTLYYVYAVFDSGGVKLIGSTSKIKPSSFSGYKKVGLLLTNISSEVSYADSTGLDGQKSIIIKEECHFYGHAGHGSTNTVIPYYLTQDFNEFDALGVISNDSTLGFSLTLKRDCTISVVVGARNNYGSGFGASGISKNSDQLTTFVADIDEDDRVSFSVYSGSVSNGNTIASAKFKALFNDVIRPHATAFTPGSTSRSYVRILAEHKLN